MKKLSLLLVLIMAFGCVSMAFTACAKDDDGDDGSIPDEKTYMVCLGDSITYGQDGTPGKEGQMKKPYPALIKDTLGYDVENIAVPGATVCTGVRRKDNSIRPTIHDQLDKIEGTPDVISVMGGVNDCGWVELGSTASGNRDATTLYGGIRVLCSELKLNYPDTFIFFITPLKTRNWEAGSSKGYDLSDVAEAIKTVCAEYDIPVYDAFNECIIDFTDENTSSDGTHIAADVIKNEVAPKIIQFIKDEYEKAE